LGRWVSEKDEDLNFWQSAQFDMMIFDENGSRMTNFYGEPKISMFPKGDFAYAWCGEKAFGKAKTLPAYLEAGKTYYLVSREKAKNTQQRFYGPVAVDSNEAIEIKSAAISKNGKTWEEVPGTMTYGPVNMLFSTEPLKTVEGNVGVPPDNSKVVYYRGWSPQPLDKEFDFGEQCAFLNGESTMECQFSVVKPDAYWITFNTALDRLSNNYKRQNWGGWTVTSGFQTVRVLIDGKDVTSTLLPQGGYEGRGKVFHYAATNLFDLQPGKHTLTLERVNPGDGTIFIDEVYLSSEADFYGDDQASNFPSGGNAFGQNAATGYHLTAQAECEMAQNWGLVPCTYEGGWAVQGDFDHYSMLAWDDLRYGSDNANPELTKQALRNAFDIWCQKGGYTYAYFYPVQRRIQQFDAPLLQCVREMNNRLSVSPEAGVMLPATLTNETNHTQGGVSTRYFSSWSEKKPEASIPEHAWKSWIVNSPSTRSYSIKLTASGGNAKLKVDNVVVAEGSASSGLNADLNLTAGVHSVKIETTDAAVAIEKIVIE
jgi:hypothetical protein